MFITRNAASLACALVCAAGVGAQDVLRAGIGRPTLTLTLGPATGGDAHLGVEVVGSEIFVTRRGSGATTTAPHSVAVLDRTGALLRVFPQVGTAWSPWGWRDGATDGQVLMFGSEAGVHVVDVTGVPISVVATANGPRTLASNPIRGAGLEPGLGGLGAYRALAFDAAGDGGDGSLWTANLASDLLEIDLEGEVLRRFPMPPAGWALFGLARDPITGNLWASAADDRGAIFEIDPATGVATGATIPRITRDAVAGGLCSVPGGLDGRRSGVDLLAIDQSGDDIAVGYRLHYWDAIPFPTEAALVNSVDGGVMRRGRVELAHPFQQSLTFDLDRPGIAYTTFFNFGNEALLRGSIAAVFPYFSELAIVAPFTVPSGGAVTIARTSGSPASAPIGALFSILGNQLIRAQSVYVESRSPTPLPLMVSNEAFWRLAPQAPAGILVTARGANSFDSDRSNGFFTVSNCARDPQRAIARLVLDWHASSNPSQAGSMVFDVDQHGMGDVPNGGDSAVVGCRGTYRNGSELACGLVFETGQSAPWCDPLAHSGFVVSNPLGPDGSYRTLEFRFQPQQFRDCHGGGGWLEFDCDTDGGLGVRGGDMAGLVVTVTLVDGTVFQGELARDPSDPELAVLAF
jgi:hypothetical protein